MRHLCLRRSLSPRRLCGDSDFVAGVVIVWGRIELHATGMRAAHARIVALELPLSRGRKRRQLVRVARRFGCPSFAIANLDPLGPRTGFRYNARSDHHGTGPPVIGQSPSASCPECLARGWSPPVVGPHHWPERGHVATRSLTRALPERGRPCR